MHCPLAVVADPSTLISPARHRQWLECRDLVARSGSLEADASDPARSRVHDTVGAVCWLQTPDGCGSVAASVSSGGLLFKAPGRVGEAAIPGAGAWCAAGDDGALRGVSVSGVGEGVMQTMLARRFCDAMGGGDDDDEAHVAALRGHAPSVCGDDAGVLTVTSDAAGVTVRAAFNTLAFGFGCTSSGDSRVRVQMARQSESGAAQLVALPMSVREPQ